ARHLPPRRTRRGRRGRHAARRGEGQHLAPAARHVRGRRGRSARHLEPRRAARRGGAGARTRPARGPPRVPGAVSAAHARPAARAPFASVWFDCDSTLSTIEGIDELARARPECAAAIAELTRRAMDGAIPLQQVYGERLRRIAPTRAEVEALARRYVATLVPGARETVAALRRLGKTVGIVSGGLRPAVLAVAHELSIPAEHVHAVDVRFAADGGYAGFDAGSPLARSG